jgi:hypothetical protein
MEPDGGTVRTCSVGVRGAECKFSAQRSALWLSARAVVLGSRIVFALYKVFWMSVDVALLLLLFRLCHGAYRAGSALATTRATSQLHLQVRKACSYDRYTRVCMQIDEHEGRILWKESAEDFNEQNHLQRTTEQLKEREEYEELMFVLSALMKACILSHRT